MPARSTAVSSIYPKDMISALLIQEGKDPLAYDMPYLRSKGRTAQQIKEQHWQCKFCAKDMTPKTGATREWHFAHKAQASECPFHTESEPESPLHLSLKRAAGEGLFRHFGREADTLEYEVRFPHIRRIADAVITLKDGTRVAVEAQISPLPLERLQERTYAYLKDEIDVIWVFMERPNGGLKEGGNWDLCREWLLDEGFMVLTAQTVIKDTAVPLPELRR